MVTVGLQAQPGTVQQGTHQSNNVKIVKTTRFQRILKKASLFFLGIFGYEALAYSNGWSFSLLNLFFGVDNRPTRRGQINYGPVWHGGVVPIFSPITLIPTPRPQAEQSENQNNKERECGICAGDEDFITLSCGHEYCVACITNVITTAHNDLNAPNIDDQRKVRPLCPTIDCRRPMTDQDIVNVMGNNEMMNSIRRQLHPIWCQQNGLRHCPTPNCNHQYMAQGTRVVTCPDCQHQYCGSCSELHDPALTCNDARVQREREGTRQRLKNEEDETQRLFERNNVKQCPRCNVNIYRTVGCDHMTCRCGHEFCWICLEPRRSLTDHRCARNDNSLFGGTRVRNQDEGLFREDRSSRNGNGRNNRNNHNRGLNFNINGSRINVMNTLMNEVDSNINDIEQSAQNITGEARQPMQQLAQIFRRWQNDMNQARPFDMNADADEVVYNLTLLQSLLPTDQQDHVQEMIRNNPFG